MKKGRIKKGVMKGGGVRGPMAMNSMRRATGFPVKPNMPKMMGKKRGGKKR